MIRIEKFVIGIRTSTRMFRVPSIIGIIIDSILSERGGKKLEDDYFLEIASNSEKNNYRLRNEELGNTLVISTDDIMFSKTYYKKPHNFDFKKIISDFTHIWQIINDNLKINDIRRIGIVAEHQVDISGNNPSNKLIESLTTFEKPKHPAKFNLKFEDRYPTAEGLAPDIHKSDFINVIYELYDAELDTEYPKKSSVNANIDVQKYYSPLLRKNIPEEVVKVYKIFEKEKAVFLSLIKKRGLIP